MKTIIFLLFYTFTCANMYAVTEEPNWKIFVANQERILISPSCLSMVEVEIKDKSEPSVISLYVFRTKNEIFINTDKFDKLINEAINLKSDKNLGDGPLISEAIDFLVKNKESGICYIISRELRLDRLSIIPLVELGDNYLPAGNGKMLAGDSQLMFLTKSWIDQVQIQTPEK
jgi:hypothetical protein